MAARSISALSSVAFLAFAASLIPLETKSRELLVRCTTGDRDYMAHVDTAVPSPQIIFGHMAVIRETPVFLIGNSQGIQFLINKDTGEISSSKGLVDKTAKCTIAPQLARSAPSASPARATLEDERRSRNAIYQWGEG